jgi:DNA primase
MPAEQGWPQGSPGGTLASQLASDFVDRVRSAIDIVALVSESVPLKKAGRKYRGLCPFHPEKTPSFYVDDAKGLFYCFGCQSGGDAFKFVMLKENVEFLEAARILARKLGVSIPEARPGRPSEREALLSAHRVAAEFYHETLKNSAEAKGARAYLQSRGITDETISRLRIGYAPDRWDALKGHLVSKGFAATLMVTGGLLSQKEGKSSTYDRFRGRVLFPIRNLSGEVVGLGGRILGNGEPKYLNSAETPIYNKRDNLFGLDLTRNGIRDSGEAVVVEGYFDFASLYQAGVANVVATLGTSFAEEQVSLLRRFTDRVVMNYDPDTAGATATRRSIDLLLAQGFKVRVLQLDAGLDPDDFVRKRGLEKYTARMADAPRYFDYLLSRAIGDKDVADYEVKSAVLKEILPVITQVPDRIERSGYINTLAERLVLDDAMMLAEIRESVLKVPAAGTSRPAQGRSQPARPESRITEAEARLIRALLESADICPDLLLKLAGEDLAGSPIEGILRAIEALSQENAVISYASLIEVLEEPARSILAGLAMKLEPVVSREEAYRCVETIRLRRLRQEREGLQKEMEHEMNTARLDDLMRRKMELSRQIDSLS